MNNHRSRWGRRRVGRKKGDTAQLAAQLAPLEEQGVVTTQDDGITSFQAPTAHQEIGAIVVEAGGNTLAEGTSGDSKKLFGLEPVVIVIVCLMLAFIGFIAWQISLMPAQ